MISINQGIYAREVKRLRPIGYWPLWEKSGSQITDQSGNGNTGSYSGGYTGAFGGPIKGDTSTGTSFNGAGSAYGAIPLDLSAYSIVAVQFWLYSPSYANDDALALEFTIQSTGGFFIDPNSGAPTAGTVQIFSQPLIGNVSYASFARPAPATWHHWVVQYDCSISPNTFTVYLDGLPQAISYGNQTLLTGNFANSTLYLMSRGGVALFATGGLSHLAIFPSLTPAQALRLYRVGRGLMPITIPQLSPPVSARGGLLLKRRRSMLAA